MNSTTRTTGTMPMLMIRDVKLDFSIIDDCCVIIDDDECTASE